MNFRVPRSPVLRRNSISVMMRSGMLHRGNYTGYCYKEKSPELHQEIFLLVLINDLSFVSVMIQEIYAYPASSSRF